MFKHINGKIFLLKEDGSKVDVTKEVLSVVDRYLIYKLKEKKYECN